MKLQLAHKLSVTQRRKPLRRQESSTPNILLALGRRGISFRPVLLRTAGQRVFDAGRDLCKQGAAEVGRCRDLVDVRNYSV